MMSQEIVPLSQSISPLLFGTPSPSPLIPGDPGYTSPTSYCTYADACVVATGRTQKIIDFLMDAHLGDFRQLKVWDEHPRRQANDHTKLQLTYEFLNRATPVEVYDGFNNNVSPVDVTVDYRRGTVVVASDDGNQDYFITYTFNFFPECILYPFCVQTLLELNYAGVDSSASMITHYHDIDSSPPTYDGIITAGALAKAWRRVASNGSLWRNSLIWGGYSGDRSSLAGDSRTSAMQQGATEVATYWQNLFDNMAKGSKFEKYIALPSEVYETFLNSGFGFYGNLGAGNQIFNGKFRGMTVNRLLQY